MEGMLWCLLVLLGVASVLIGTSGHGRLMEPPSRGSMWRQGFDSPVDYGDNQLFCGGRKHQWDDMGGKCGVCGDPYDGPRNHEPGGKYYSGIITRSYKEAQVIAVQVELTAFHFGWFEFRLCPLEYRNQSVGQDCFDQNLLRVETDSTSNSPTRYKLPADTSLRFVNLKLKLPDGVTCQQCVLQWKYHAANSWGIDADGKSCVGCGKQEEFYGCSDVTIQGNDQGPSYPWIRAQPPANQNYNPQNNKPSLTKAQIVNQLQNQKAASPEKKQNDWYGAPTQGKKGRVNKNIWTPIIYKKPTSKMAPPEPQITYGDAGESPQGQCKAAGAWQGQQAMTDWCIINCERGFCPKSHCNCDEDVGYDESKPTTVYVIRPIKAAPSPFNPGNGGGTRPNVAPSPFSPSMGGGPRPNAVPSPFSPSNGGGPRPGIIQQKSLPNPSSPPFYGTRYSQPKQGISNPNIYRTNAVQSPYPNRFYPQGRSAVTRPDNNYVNHKNMRLNRRWETLGLRPKPIYSPQQRQQNPWLYFRGQTFPSTNAYHSGVPSSSYRKPGQAFNMDEYENSFLNLFPEFEDKKASVQYPVRNIGGKSSPFSVQNPGRQGAPYSAQNSGRQATPYSAQSARQATPFSAQNSRQASPYSNLNRFGYGAASNPAQTGPSPRPGHRHVNTKPDLSYRPAFYNDQPSTTQSETKNHTKTNPQHSEEEDEVQYLDKSEEWLLNSDEDILVKLNEDKDLIAKARFVDDGQVGQIAPEGKSLSLRKDRKDRKSEEKCRAVGLWEGLGFMDAWCDLNCKVGNCPKTHCSCSE